jgi:hypothetical protein
VFVKSHFFAALIVKFILLSFIFFLAQLMAIVLMKEAQLVVVVNDLDFGVKDFAFEIKVLNRFGTFD